MEKSSIVLSVIKLFRPQHYIKNLFVFLPLFFAGQFSNLHLIANAAFAFLCFSLISSSVYIFNDIFDVNEDRIHPVNRSRPIASGAVSKSLAHILDLVLTIGALSLSFLYSRDLFYIILCYKILNIAYTMGLKRIPVIDVMLLSLGFVLRLYAGSSVTDVILTEWIIILTFLLSMLLALGKRRNDAIVFKEEEILLRSSAKSYNVDFLNYSMIIIASVIIVAYIMYTLSPDTIERMGTSNLYITGFWVLSGILRYLQLLFVHNRNDSPVKILLDDHPLKLILLAWLLNFLFFIYVI